MLPTEGLKNELPYFKCGSLLDPVGRPLMPNYYIRLKELELAMIGSALLGKEKKVLEARDIVGLAKKTVV